MLYAPHNLKRRVCSVDILGECAVDILGECAVQNYPVYPCVIFARAIGERAKERYEQKP